jgi:hypothetical protein
MQSVEEEEPWSTIHFVEETTSDFEDIAVASEAKIKRGLGAVASTTLGSVAHEAARVEE